MTDLKEVANEEYYNTGETILTDYEFDLLAENGLEIKNFRNKTEHFQPMGSLNKIKTEEKFLKWLAGQKRIMVSPKLDGNSIELVIEDLQVVQAITRGDGFIGNDITDKIFYCQIPSAVMTQHLSSSKCEAIMLKTESTNYDKNLRNVVSGILGRKTPQPDELKKIFILDFNSIQQEMLDPTYEKLETLFNDWKENYNFEIDGIVVSHISDVHEEKDELLPENTIALKFNKEGVDGIIGNVEVNLGKYGYLTPVLVLKEGIEIDGTIVKRVSASNYGLLSAAGLWPGAEVQVIKSGDIIPFISAVIKPSNNIQDIKCPNCDNIATISENGIHAICENCKNDGLVYLKHVFGIFDLEFISDSTIEKLYEEGYTKLEDYFNLNVDKITMLKGFGKSKATNIVSKLKNITLTEAQVLKCAMIEGMGEKQCQRIIDNYKGFNQFLLNIPTIEEIANIDGFGDVMAERVVTNHKRFFQTWYLLKTFCKIISEEPKSIGHLGNVVFTGKCEKYGRKELTEIFERMGYNVQGSIGKDTNLLVTNDPESGSSKIKKVKKLGIKIVTYLEFLE